MYINNIFIVYDNGWDWVVYLKSVENVITLGKLIGLLFLFCLPLLSIFFLKTKRNDLARPVMGTIFLVIFCFLCYSLCYSFVYYPLAHASGVM